MQDGQLKDIYHLNEEAALQTAPYIDAILPDGVFPDKFLPGCKERSVTCQPPKEKHAEPCHAPCDSPTFFVPAAIIRLRFLSDLVLSPVPI